MSMPPHICIALMDDPVYKQSSIRVADALVRAGYRVTLIGRRLDPERPAGAEPAGAAAGGPNEAGPHGARPNTAVARSASAADAAIEGLAGPAPSGAASGPNAVAACAKRVRFRPVFKRGKLFYAEMNLRILLYLLTHRVDLVCAVNLDTIIPCWIVSKLKRIPRVYDARELFTELAEVVARPRVQKMWLWVERTMVPRFPNGYAVCQSIAEELEKRYNIQYAVVRNMTVLKAQDPGENPMDKPYLLYQGAVNVGRGLDALIPAMQGIDLPLVVCGTGNFMEQCRALVEKHGLDDKVIFTGQLPPGELIPYTYHAFAGLNLVEREGLNQYFSLPNKLFDYIHAGIPQVTMDYPEYRRVQEQFEVGVLIPDVTVENIRKAVEHLQKDPALYDQLRANCKKARTAFNWQVEEPGLIRVYKAALKS
ncbi:glycosyltransferase [Dinghuibacter silviterrae]|uniref:Glycosyltransferase involved in cell wall biosynthesis n=1 Tax=Dinghuibacter silviterrae TaxID=1539049 RepID=A0A4R8DW73_9BACT|nr:glycosyltransferase [Dinghuibacter silviterrae]TDX01657.1 glycosyltransferase involved in cell wall biosynthesis [Dinghuibacter silviterrae]